MSTAGERVDIVSRAVLDETSGEVHLTVRAYEDNGTTFRGIVFKFSLEDLPQYPNGGHLIHRKLSKKDIRDTR